MPPSKTIAACPTSEAIHESADRPAPFSGSDCQPIRFFHRGQVVEVTGEAPTRSVLEWLREDARCVGTKEGCNEGDCGACTVVVAELAAGAPGGLRLQTVNACIRFLPTLDGKALFTVEDLKALNDGRPHPVQQALVDCHGSQCGFCTPGFAMSLWSVCEAHPVGGSRPTRAQLADALSGNLCRCTGYRPILDAAERMFDLPAAPLDRGAVAEALRGLQRDRGVCHGTPAQTLHAPRTLEELDALRARLPGARLLAGGTDIAVWVNKQHRELGELISLGEVQALRHIEAHGDGSLSVGATASLDAAWRALARMHPSLTEMGLRFASPPIRHAGSLGGNIANGSPIGDGAPVLMALRAEVELRLAGRTRRLPLDGFYTGYMRNLLQPGEFVQALWVPAAVPGLQVRAYKVSKRFDSDISTVCAGFALSLNPQDGTVSEVRLAFGGMAATVKRAATAEAALTGRPWSHAAVQDACDALKLDFVPLSDLRGSAAYRSKVAGNLLRRFWLETRLDDPLPPQSLRVRAVDADWAGGGAP